MAMVPPNPFPHVVDPKSRLNKLAFASNGVFVYNVGRLGAFFFACQSREFVSGERISKGF